MFISSQVKGTSVNISLQVTVRVTMIRGLLMTEQQNKRLQEIVKELNNCSSERANELSKEVDSIYNEVMSEDNSND